MSAKLERKQLEKPDETRPFKDGKGKVEIVKLGGHTIGRCIYEPGWRWSEHVKPIVGTSSCQVEHTGVVLEGRLAVETDGGERTEYGPGDAFHVAPGHQFSVVGDKRCVMIDFTGMENYAKPGARAAASEKAGRAAPPPH